MKTIAFATALTAACAAIAVGASPELPTAQQLQAFPKNLARQHYSANLFVFDSAVQRYAPTEAAAAWLDEDSVTGWPMQAGKQYYMLQLADARMITNFELSAKAQEGTVSLFIGDQALPPGDAAWTQVAKDIPFASVNQKRLPKALNKTAKYVLIETNVAVPGPVYSLYVYGDRAAATEAIMPRVQPIDTHIIGEFVNQQTAFNVASLYANSRVSFANGKEGNIAWQRAIDDNAETAITVTPDAQTAGAVVRFGSEQPVSRLSVLSDEAARGTMDIFLLSQAPSAGQPVGLEGVTPSASLKFDGTAGRASADVAETKAVAVAFRWTPEGGQGSFTVREIAAFANISLNDYEVAGAPMAIAAGEGTEGSGKESKDVIASGPSGKDAKALAPVAEGPLAPVEAGPGGFTPGGLGFPPRILRNPVSP